MNTTCAASIERVKQLAERLDCFTDEEVQELAGVTATTSSAWRKRGLGPAYILFGNRYLYPRQAVAEFLQGQVRTRKALGAEALV